MDQNQPKREGWIGRWLYVGLPFASIAAIATLFLSTPRPVPPKPSSQFPKETRQKIYSEYQAGMVKVNQDFTRIFLKKKGASDLPAAQEMANQREYFESAKGLLRAQIEDKWKLDDAQLDDILATAQADQASNSSKVQQK